MGWDDDYEDSNGAHGECQECGSPTAEEWHAYCSDCHAEQNGCRKPRPEPDESPRSFVVGLDELREEVRALRKRVALLERERAAA
jgi:hypothetical protein